MSKANQREYSYFRQGQIDRKETQKNQGNFWNWGDIKRSMKKLYKQRLSTKRLSNMYGTYWFKGWNNPNAKKISF